MLRLLHKKLSFWTAKEECKSLGGQLLLLENAKKVMKALGDSMVGNVASDYRIDGWSEGKWFEGPDRSNPALIQSKDHSFLNVFKNRTLSLDLEDGSVGSKRHLDVMIGAVCQGEDGVGKASNCKQDTGKCNHPAPGGNLTNYEVLDDNLMIFMYKDGGYTYKDFYGANSTCFKMGGTGLAKLETAKEVVVAKKLAKNLSEGLFWASQGTRRYGSDDRCGAFTRNEHEYRPMQCRDSLSFFCEHRC